MARLEAERMFVAVVETGSFTAAAGRAGTRSGQASKLVARLEAELGVRLLDRTTRSVAPTEAGLIYYQRLRAIIDEFDSLDQEIRAASGSPRGRLRISAPLYFGTRVLAPVLNDFARLFPEIELDVSFSDRLVSLVDEGFDVAVRMGRPADSSLIARKLADTGLVTVASDAYLAARGEPACPGDLARHDCILDSNFRDPGRWPFRGPGGRAVMVPVSGRIRHSNAEACLDAAERGLGIACLPDFVAVPALERGIVRPILQGFAPEGLQVDALVPAGRHQPAKVRALIDHLAARLAGPKRSKA